MDPVPISALVQRLKQETTVWVRLAANKPQNDWQLALLEVTLGEPPPHWQPRSWVYDRAVFDAAELAGETAAGWLDDRIVAKPPLSIPIAVHDNVSRDRHDSRFVGVWEPYL